MRDNMLLNLCDIVLRGAIKDYYWACKKNDEDEKKELRHWFRSEAWVTVYLSLMDIDVDTLLGKIEKLD